MREILSFIVEKFNGFRIVAIEQEKKNRKKFRPVDIIYEPVQKNDELINCCFSEKLNFGFRGKFTEGNDIKTKDCLAWQCYFCSSVYGKKDKFKRHIENFTGQSGIVYNFNTQNLITFENDLKYGGHIPLVAYIDFETTAPTNENLDPENEKMYTVFYVIIFAFHPELNIDRVIIERSFGHSTNKLTSLNYLTRE